MTILSINKTTDFYYKKNSSVVYVGGYALFYCLEMEGRVRVIGEKEI